MDALRVDAPTRCHAAGRSCPESIVPARECECGLGQSGPSIRTVRIYPSAYRLGARVDVLAAHVGRAAIIMNALDPFLDAKAQRAMGI